jgi:hypothetical protein
MASSLRALCRTACCRLRVRPPPASTGRIACDMQTFPAAHLFLEGGACAAHVEIERQRRDLGENPLGSNGAEKPAE